VALYCRTPEEIEILKEIGYEMNGGVLKIDSI
jgi:hypothetical protein